MRFFGNRGIGMLLLFLLAGAIIGGLLGEVLEGANFTSFMPYLTKQYSLIDLNEVKINLFVLDISFSIHFAPNLLSLLGLVLAAIFFSRL